MITTKNSVGVATPSEFLKPSIFAVQKFQSHFNSNRELTQAEKQKRHSIFLCLIAMLRNERFVQDSDFCEKVFDLPKVDFAKDFGIFETDDLYKLGFCAIPNFILNALVCEKLSKCFGDLSVCGCFDKTDGTWRLDFDEYLSRNGLFLPFRGDSGVLISGLKVFRHSKDKRPFMLKARGDRKYD